MGDNDPGTVWRHRVVALDRVRPGIGERVGPLLGPLPSLCEGLVTALLNELAGRPGEDEVLLVLDGYHLIGVEPVQTTVNCLLEHLPPGRPYGGIASRQAAFGRSASGTPTELNPYGCDLRVYQLLISL